jgi:hypothetical protein
MRLVAQYSHKNGLTEISQRHANLLAEAHSVIKAVNALGLETNPSPRSDESSRLPDQSAVLGGAFQRELFAKGWTKLTLSCGSSAAFHFGSQVAVPNPASEFRVLDFVKSRLGVEVQFGKPPLPVCSVCASMTIFHNLGHIECGVEIVPVKALALEMSSGVSYFEQFVWDLRQRGVADIDIPVLILGIDV